MLSNGQKLKGINYSTGEDFSESVRKAQKNLVAFARTKSEPFSLWYRTLFLSKKGYTFNKTSQSVT